MNKNFGANILNDGKVNFVAWAPFAKSMELEIPQKAKTFPMSQDEWGFWEITSSEIKDGDEYFFIIVKVDSFSPGCCIFMGKVGPVIP